jgi:hypothetical protein
MPNRRTLSTWNIFLETSADVQFFFSSLDFEDSCGHFRCDDGVDFFSLENARKKKNDGDLLDGAVLPGLFC